ncbi:MAG: UbiA family prenyltransferase [Chloroflexota bacterium]|nr:UbiA family prenyltransferase [Chloroflexota bacterium]
MKRRLAGLRVVHPFPSALNALLVLALAQLAGGDPMVAGVLAGAMLALQFSIGAANDVFDERFDSRSKPTKPIPAGLITRRTAVLLAASSAAVALAVAALFGPAVLFMAGAMLAAGLAYDAWLKRGPWAWAAFSIAFPILPLYAWYGATGAPPPRYDLLLPVAALAGPALHLANGVVDAERDRQAGLLTLVTRLGRRRAVGAMALLLGMIHGAAWLTLLVSGAGFAIVLPATVASGLASVGVVLSASHDVAARERGWQVQAGAICLLAVSWLMSVLR